MFCQSLVLFTDWLMILGETKFYVVLFCHRQHPLIVRVRLGVAAVLFLNMCVQMMKLSLEPPTVQEDPLFMATFFNSADKRFASLYVGDF